MRVSSRVLQCMAPSTGPSVWKTAPSSLFQRKETHYMNVINWFACQWLKDHFVSMWLTYYSHQLHQGHYTAAHSWKGQQDHLHEAWWDGDNCWCDYSEMSVAHARLFKHRIHIIHFDFMFFLIKRFIVMCLIYYWPTYDYIYPPLCSPSPALL